MKDDVLPDSRTKETRGRVVMRGTVFVPIYCANCGAPGGGVPEEHMTFAFYLCNACAEKWGPIAGTMVVPDEIFFERVKQWQLENYGRFLEAHEIVEELENPNSSLAKLAREAPKGR